MELVRRPKEKGLWSDLFEIRDHFNRLFDTPLLNTDSAREGFFAPEVDITGNDDEITIKADLPGIDAKNVKIDVRDNVLTITGERKEENEKKEKNYYRSERFFGTFQRSFALPDGLDQEKVKASYKNGVLTVAIPKSEKVKPKQISIEVEE
ncbi:MAG: Hsp20/alpha crystallin family protein [Candidatus Auribacterota bacterium]|nr:Hsp20/alpha crystallin family protein [Candidatus Auribacterota bacterium]